MLRLNLFSISPFPASVRTLDALHLASLAFLRGRGREVELATYDGGMAEAAEAMGFGLWEAVEA